MRNFTTSDGLTLAFRDEGKGTPVLCLSGLTRNSTDFDFLRAQIGAEVRMICLDYRGRGASDWDANCTNYTVPVEARDAIELLDYLGIPKAVLIGTSRGGLIAMLIAATAKDRLAGVCLNDIGPELAGDGLEKIKGYLGRDPSYKTMEEAALGLPDFYADSFQAVPAERWAACAERWWTQTQDGLKINYDPKLRDAVLEAPVAEPDLMWSLFDALTGLPLALIRGANSDLLSAETAAEMRARRADMVYTDVPGRGHVPFLDEAEALAAVRSLLLRVDI